MLSQALFVLCCVVVAHCRVPSTLFEVEMVITCPVSSLPYNYRVDLFEVDPFYNPDDRLRTHRGTITSSLSHNYTLTARQSSDAFPGDYYELALYYKNICGYTGKVTIEERKDKRCPVGVTRCGYIVRFDKKIEMNVIVEHIGTA